MKSEEFDARCDRGDDVSDALELAKAHRPGLEQRRVNVDSPAWMVESLDAEANRLGITRQAVIKTWVAQRLDQRAA